MQRNICLNAAVRLSARIGLVHELGASADTCWLREPLQSDSSCNEASSTYSKADGGGDSTSAGSATRYTASLGELRHRLEDLAKVVRRMEEAEGRVGECQSSGFSLPRVEMGRDIELTCGARVRLAASTD